MSLVNRMFRVTVSIALLAPTICYIFLGQTASAAQVTSRKVTISSSEIDADNVTYTFSFIAATATAVKSVSFKPCTTASGTCTAPTGFLQGGARSTISLNGQPSSLGSGTWTIDTTTATGGLDYSLLMNNSGNVTAQSTENPVIVSFNGVHNPSEADGMTFYMLITTYSQDDYTSPIDDGVTAAATVLQIILSGTMPESLIFCVGDDIDAVENVPNCATADSGTVSFNQLFSPSDTAYATSEMAASTNAGTGYVITVNGTTLTNGSYTIAAMGTRDFSKHGISQFGLNLVANTGMVPPAGTVPYTTYGAFGANVSLAANGTNYKGQPVTVDSGYDVADYFRFVSGATVANSANGGTPGPSDGQIFTVSYIANVPGSLAAGTYTTTLTYICTPTF